MKYELQMWVNAFLKGIPGKTGCFFRNLLLPYKQGKNVTVWDHTHIDSPSKLSMGNHVSINRNCVLNAGGGIEIGNDVLIGPNVTIYSQNHNILDSSKPIREQGYTTKRVIIKSNVWIASNVTILPGVIIGENCVIGANSLVNKSIPANSLVAGNPAVVLKRLYTHND